MLINNQGFLTGCDCAWSPPEDEQQQKSLSGNKTVRQLTMERDQAMADLNSVERSLSDLFRRYENLKTVLEGFKKVSPSLSQAVVDELAPAVILSPRAKRPVSLLPRTRRC
jgi:hypothetical protein